MADAIICDALEICAKFIGKIRQFGKYGKSMNREISQGVESRYGWVIVAAAAVLLGIGNGSLNTISVTLKPIVAEMGWLRGETAFAYMAGVTATGVFGILMGYLSDRFSVRSIVLLGAVALGGALLLLSRLTALWEFYLYFCLLGGLGVGALFAPLIAHVGKWFDRSAGLALGITTAGQALGQGLWPLLTSFLIASQGWRQAYATIGVIALLLLIPCALLMRPAPAPHGLTATGGPGRGGGKTPSADVPLSVFLPWLGLAVIFCCIVMATPLVHVVALASDRGIAPTTAASVFTAILVAGALGRIFFGRLTDRIGGLRGHIAASAGQTAMVFWFTQLHSLPAFYVLAVIFGFLYGGVMTCMVICIRQFTPDARRAFCVAVTVCFAWVGMGLGAWQGGYFFDLTENYLLSFANAAGAGVVNLAILTGLHFYLARKGKPAPEPAAA